MLRPYTVIIGLTLEHLQDIKIVNARSEISFLQIVPNVSHAVEYAIKIGLKQINTGEGNLSAWPTVALLLSCGMQKIVCFVPVIGCVRINNFCLTGCVAINFHNYRSCHKDIINSYICYQRIIAHNLLHTAG